MFELGTEEYLRHGIKMTPKQKDPRKQAKKIQKAESDGKPDKQGMYGQDESVDVYTKQTPGQNKKANYDSFKKIYKASKKNSVPKKSSMKEGMKYSDYKKLNEGALSELADVIRAFTPFALAIGGVAGVLGALGIKLIGAVAGKLKQGYKSIVKNLRDDSKNKLVSMQETIKNFEASESDKISRSTRKNASTKLKDFFTKFYGIKRVQAICDRMGIVITDGTNEFVVGLLAEKTQVGQQLKQEIEQKGGAKNPQQQTALVKSGAKNPQQTAAESVTHKGTLLLEKKELSKEQQKQMAEQGKNIQVDAKLPLTHFSTIYPKTKEYKQSMAEAMKEFPLSDFNSLLSSSELQIKEETYIDLLIAERIKDSKSMFLVENKKKIAQHIIKIWGENKETKELISRLKKDFNNSVRQQVFDRILKPLYKKKKEGGEIKASDLNTVNKILEKVKEKVKILDKEKIGVEKKQEAIGSAKAMIASPKVTTALAIPEPEKDDDKNSSEEDEPKNEKELKQQDVKIISADTQVLSQVSKTEGNYYSEVYQARVKDIFADFPAGTLDGFTKTLVKKMSDTRKQFALQEAGKLNTKYDNETITKILDTEVFTLTDNQIVEIFSTLYGTVDNPKERYPEDFKRFYECLRGGTCVLSPGGETDKKKESNVSEEQEERAKRTLEEIEEIEKKAMVIMEDKNLSDDEKERQIAKLVKKQADLKKLLALSKELGQLKKQEEKQTWLSNLVGNETFAHLRGTAVENVIRKLVGKLPYVGDTLSEILTPLLALPGSGGAGGALR